MKPFSLSAKFVDAEAPNDNLTCSECGCNFSLEDYEFVDAEFDEVECLCPNCQLNADLVGYPCDYCEEPATHSVGSTYYCEGHFEDLVGD